MSRNLAGAKNYVKTDEVVAYHVAGGSLLTLGSHLQVNSEVILLEATAAAADPIVS